MMTSKIYQYYICVNSWSVYKVTTYNKTKLSPYGLTLNQKMLVNKEKKNKKNNTNW